MGQIFKASQTSLDRVVALKLLPKSMARDRALVERLYREAKAAARIIHPNVVQIYSVGEEHGVPYFAMEYVEGDDLEKMLSGGRRFTLEEAIDLVAAVALALSAAGELGIVHRDIKPANIMITKAGVVKVTDFGLAKPTASADAMNITQAGYIVGTPTYMSPEQAEGTDVDIRSDMYSLGVVFYELLTGMPPFIADSPAALIYKHVHEDPRLPSEANEAVPPELDSILLKCLAKKKEDRYTSPGDFLADLLALRRNLGVEAGNTIVFDTSQAERFVGKTPPPVDSAVSTKPRDTVESKSPFAALTTIMGAVVAGVVIIVAVGGYLLYRKSHTSGGPDTPVPQPPVVSTQPPPPRKGDVQVDFAFLETAIPKGTTCLLRSKDGASPLPYTRLNLKEGSYSIMLTRDGYLPLVRTFTVEEGEVLPALRPELFQMEPRPELVAAYDDAKKLLEQEDLEGALAALEKAMNLDPGYLDTAALAASIKTTLDSAVKAREEKWEKATEFYAKGEFEHAVKLLKDINTDNIHFTEAQNIIKLAEDRLAELAKIRTACMEAIKKGEVSNAEKELAALEKVAGERPAAQIFLRENKRLLAELRDHMAAADSKDLSDAEKKKRLLAIMKIAPLYKPARTAAEKLDERLQARSIAQGMLATAQGLFDKDQFQECIDTIAKAREAWSEGLPGMDELAERARLGTVRLGLSDTLAAWRQVLCGAAPARNPFVDAALADKTRTYVSGAPFPVRKFDIVLTGFTETQNGIDADVSFMVVLDPTPAGEFMLNGVLKTSFILSGASYYVKAVTLGNGDAKGDSEEADPGKLQRGTVKSRDGALVRVDFDSPDTIPLGETVLFYGEGEVVLFPYSDKVALRRPKVVARGRVLRRVPGGVTVDIGAPVEPVAEGTLAVYDPGQPAVTTPPRVLSLKGTVASSTTSTPIELKADVANPDDAPAAFSWSATGGRLLAELTPTPVNTWYPPSEPGKFKVAVALKTGAEKTSSAEVEIEGLGPTGKLPQGYRSEGLLSIGGGVFQQVRHIAFDSANNAYVLDGLARKIVVLAAGTLRTAGEYALPRGGDFQAIAVYGGKIYLLDTTRAAIIRCALDEKEGLKPEVSFGGKGNGNGFLNKPVDFAILRDGTILVVDQMSQSIESFAPDGRFLFSIGAPGKSTGNLDKPVAIVADKSNDYHVLDAGRSAVLHFRVARLIGESILAERDVPAADMAYDAFMDRLVVLSENGDGYARTNFTWKKIFAGGTEVGQVKDPVTVAADRMGVLYVADRRGKAVELFREDAFAGQLGGEILDSVDRFAIAGDGSMYLLDGRNALVGKISSQGALIGRFGGRGKGAVMNSPGDIEAGPDGSLYILDQQRRQVLKFSSAGELLGTIGESGKLPAKQLLQPIDMFVSGDHIYVLQDTGQYCVHIYSAKDGSLLQAFPGMNDERLRSVQAVAADAAGNIRVVVARKPLHVFSPQGGLVTVGKTNLTPVNASAASPDGTIAFLDGARNVLYVFGPGDEEKLVAVDLSKLVQEPLDISTDAFGGIWVLGNRGHLVRLVPVW